MATIVKEERRQRGFAGWVVVTVFWIFNLMMAVALFVGLAAVGDGPAATSEAERAGQAIGTAIGMGMLLSIWMAGVVILGTMVLLTRGRKIIVERNVA